MNALNLLSCTMLVAALLLVVSGVAAERITSDYVTERDQGTVEHNSTRTRVTGSDGPLRIRISGIQNKQDTSVEIDNRMSDSRSSDEEEGKAIPHVPSQESYPVNTATTASPVSRDLDREQSAKRPTSIDEGEEEQDEEEEEDESMAKLVQEPSAPSPIEQLGQALKIMGTFMSWARAINPSEGQSLPRSNAEILPETETAVAAGQRLQSQLRKGLIGESRADSGSDPAPTESASTEVAEGRHIKGDPLKGYYDFVITEGSYKFWAVFQLATAALIIYSTFAAIYYSKVNPITSDYDYVDYFGGRALGSVSGRSLSDLDNTDVVDDDGEEDEEDAETEGELHGVPKSGQRNETTSQTKTTPDSERSFLSHWTSIFEGGRRAWWIDTAASGFHFVLDAIDKMPQ